MRRFATIALSLCLLLGLAGVHHLFAQDDPKKDEPSKSEPSKPEAAKTETPKDKEAAPKPDASATSEAPLAPIPPEVEAKLEAARRAVAEAIVAAQDAGLVKTSIDPPPILDILITGRATDEETLKARTGVSPEVFGAWFTGQGTAKDITPMKDVRIYNPTAGLKDFYDQRASILNRHIAAVRKAQGTAKKEETPAKEEVKETPPAAKEKEKEEPKKEAAKDDKESKKEETPANDAKKEEPKPEKKEGEAKKDGSDSNPAKDDAKKDDNKVDASKDYTPK